VWVKNVFNLSVIIFLLLSLGIRAQVTFENKVRLSDTIAYKKDTTATVPPVKPKRVLVTKLPPRPDPSKVVWMSAVLPGYGQIQNRKYWKLPIVYGGFAGCAYAVFWNSAMYAKYRTAYRDIIDNDPTTNTFISALPKGYTVETFGGTSYYTTALKTVQDSYRRSRDLSILGSIGFYALTLVDAYVDAQLFDFDISPDLSLRIAPIAVPNSSTQLGQIGLQCKFNIK
jgi:hypothetical protein